jgi:hypothetical protein
MSVIWIQNQQTKFINIMITLNLLFRSKYKVIKKSYLDINYGTIQNYP